ncbi:alpha/beta hydrolase-fold protein [Corynebacterium sp. 335C]
MSDPQQFRTPAGQGRLRRTRAGLRRASAVAAALPVAAVLLAPVAGAPAALAEPAGAASSMFTPAPESGNAPAPVRETDQQLGGLPAGVSVEKVQWLSERHVRLLINSAAMPDQPIPVELLLPRDWNRTPDRTFPTVWHLDGMRATEDGSGWTRETTIDEFYADKNVMVVMPVGGESSFYTDWEQGDNGKMYKWETFLIQEMIPVLQQGWRANGDRAITGLSMGGTAAMNLAQHHPDLFRFVASFSGYLDTTSPGMPAAIAAAMDEAGGYDATKMWGPFGSSRWKENDPKLHVERFKGMGVYVSAGNGNAGQWDTERSKYDRTKPANPAGWGLELISRMTTETFVQVARRADVPVTVQFRDSGTHSWPYWQFETTQAWPHMADSLGLAPEDRGVTCTVGGEIANAVASVEGLGHCLTGEYATAHGGLAQDFANGRAYWHPDHGAHILWGRIGARYAEIGGPASPLGHPLTGEKAAPDGKGRFVHFEHGSIYWTPDTGAQIVLGDVVNAWGATGWERGPLGYPTSDRYDVPGGVAQDFQGGQIIRRGDGEPQAIHGRIGEAYRGAGGPGGWLGYPKSGELPLRDGGRLVHFERGSIYWTPETGAASVPNGSIRDHWGSTGWENGPFGYPVGDQRQIPAGGLEQEFQGGWIREINGRIEEDRNE